ncbi:uncharacterized protein LOC119729773 [Patiria miniata]|uniref:VWFC domain-containing protein n=1 Tax=Patiria miniata TaxID=46514 RepID=A0A914A3L9_PATMI|nr:uncharacterized protein LOC119729773 [Patiria miniata]
MWSTGGIVESELASDLSFSIGSSFVEPLLPCPHLSEIYMHGETWQYDDCTTCTCDNSTTKCVIESCQDLPCTDRIFVDGECCGKCPFYAIITSLSPVLSGLRPFVTEGNTRRVQLNMDVGFVNSDDTTTIRGKRLWQLSTWISRDPRGEGPQIAFVEQVLTVDQQATTLLKRSPFRFRNINYAADLVGETCAVVKYICVRFAQEPTANPSFFFSAEPDEEVLTECILAPPCQGVVARGLTWNYRASTVIAGQANPLFIMATAHFMETSRSVSGTGLWRLGIFGSRSEFGYGERFNYVNQTLKAVDANKPLVPGTSADIKYAEAMAYFDIAAIGCNGFNYACMELTKGDNAEPDFTFSVFDDREGDDIFTVCEMATCRAVSQIREVNTELIMGSIVDNRPVNPFSITMEVSGDNVGAAGMDLWRVSAFGSNSPQGLGPKLNYQTQVLSEEQQDITLELLRPMHLGAINFNFDMTGLTCLEVSYICLTFNKLEESTTVFSLNPVTEEVLTNCKPTECDAVFARHLSWDHESEQVTLGLKSPITISSMVEFTPTGKNVSGTNLWKLSLFGSKNKQGTGDRFTPIEQLLTDSQTAMTMRSGSPLHFDDLRTEFDVGWLGCGEFQFLCLEFARGDNPEPEFHLLYETNTTSLVTCKRSTCESVLNLENFQVELVRGSVVDGSPTNRFVLRSSMLSPDLGISGDDLWQMTAFGSRNADGVGQRYYEQAQVLDRVQQDMGVETGQELNFDPIRLNFDMTRLSCRDVRYLCLTLEKNPSSSVDFSLSAEDGLTRCVEVECEGVFARSLNWQYRPVSVTLGQDSPLVINATVQMTDLGSTLSGSNLWQLGIFGSKSATGEGPRYNRQKQILSRRQARLEYSPLGSQLRFDQTGTTFDIGAIGCSEFTHLCLEFGKAESPRPQFPFFTEDGASTLVQCQERACSANVGIKPLSTRLRQGSIVDNRPINRIRMDASTQSVDLGVAGNNLWRLSTFGSSNNNGTGTRYGEQLQALNQRQRGTTLPPDGGELDFGSIEFNFDMTEMGCAEVRFMCMSFSRDPGASLEFTLIPQPESALTSCQPLDCEGVYAESLSFDLETPELILGQKSPVIVHANVTMSDISADVSGEQLWKLSLFGSQNPDGQGERFGTSSQILSEELEGLDYERGSPLVFPESISLFNIGAIGCKKGMYVCLEFGQTNRPRPQFHFFTVTGEPTLITCQERSCESAIRFNPLQTTLISGSVVDDRTQNRIQMGVSIDGSTVGMTGSRLWELSTFASSNPDGSGKRYLERQQVLNGAQADSALLPGQPLNFGNVDFNFDMTGRGCGEVQYACVTLQRNPRASIEFDIEAQPDESALTSCQRLDCDGVFFESMNWLYETDPVMLGEETGMDVHAMIQSKAGTRDVQGEGLWQLNLFASRNPDGSEDRLGLKRQILDEQTASQPLEGSTPLNLLNVRTAFDLSRVGCSEYLYLCLEFARGRIPNPPFYMFTTAGTPTLISCQTQPCQSAVDIVDVASTPVIGDVVEERPLNLLTFNLTAFSSPSSVGLAGSNLWRVTVFGSNSRQGEGPELNPQEQALAGSQADMDLKPGGRVEFGPLNVNYNMLGVDCTSISYVCARLGKNPSASVDYTLQATPDESVLTQCQPVNCRGVLAESLTWGYNARNTIINQPSPITVDATVDMSDSRQLSGSGLWRMGLFASQNGDGTGPRLNYTEQILDARAAGTPLATNYPLSIGGVQTEFDIGSLGCAEFTHLCAEFSQGENPSPGFKFEVSGSGEMITKCMEVECAADVTLSGLSAVLTNNKVKEGSGNQFRLQVRATPGRDTKGVAGSGLWQLSAYVTSDPSSDEKLALRTQTLTLQQEDLTLQPRQILDFGNVEYKHDLTGVQCSQTGYLCVELNKGPSPSTTFNLLTVPEGSPLKACNPLQCKGVQVDRIDWSYEASNVIPGKQTPFAIQASISMTEDTRELSGKGLWRLGLFGSRNPDGSGERHDYVRQTLNRDQSGSPITSGGNVDLADINTQFDAGTVGCTDYQYICLEVAKGDTADPDFTFGVTNHRSDSTAEEMVSCKKAPCDARAEFINLNAALTDNNPILEDNRDNEVYMSVLALASLQSSAIMGENLWQLKAYLSSDENGRGRQYALQPQILTSSEQRNEPLEAAGDLSWMDLRVPLDMSGLECSKTPYLCLTLEKNDKSTMDFTVVGIPDDDVLNDCIDITSRCEGVVATELEWSHEVGDFMAGQPASLSLDVAVKTTDKSRDVEGLRLWRLGLFGSRQANGGGPRLANVDQILDPYRQATQLTGGTPLQFTDIPASYDLGQLGCSDYQFLCLEFEKADTAQPDFAFKILSGEETLVSCKPQPCRGIYLTGLTSTPGAIELREGSSTNTIEFTSEATSSPLGGGVQGANLWRMAVYGSGQPDGRGPRYGFQSQALTGYHRSLPLAHAGDPIEFQSVAVDFDMRGVKCANVKHFCTELSKDPASSPDFQLMPVPNDEVLTSCFPVPARACTGLVLSNMDWTMESGKVVNDQSNDFSLNIDVDSLPGGAQVAGSRLWRVGIFGSRNEDGTGDRLGYRAQILDRRTASASLTPGSYLRMTDVQAQYDFSRLGCELEYQYFCVEFAKGVKAHPDFNMRVQGRRGNTLVNCKMVECKQPIKIGRVQTQDVGNNANLVEGNRYNRVMFTLDAATTPDSGSLTGDRLWALTVFGSQDPTGTGRKLNPQNLYTLSRYQESKDVDGGQPILFGYVDVNYDMTGLSCTDVKFICAKLRKHDNPSPDFELIAVPDPRVLTDCFQVKCDGVIVEGTRLELSGSSELDVGVNDLNFDVSVVSSGNGAEVSGRNLWRVEFFTARNREGTEEKSIIQSQTLTPQMASQDLQAGAILNFRNLAARINRDQLGCQHDNFLCVNLQKADRPSKAFTLEGASPEALVHCLKVSCVKKR